jgi:hypothetical protein
MTLAALAVVAFGGACWAGTRTLEVSPESRLWLEGDSTLHPYESIATTLDVNAAVNEQPGQNLLAAFGANGLTALSVRVPVGALKSPHAGLDKNLRKALGADKNPDITFVMTGCKAQPSDDGTTLLLVAGNLSVAGVEKPVELKAVAAGAGPVRVTGEQKVLMTDHGVKPPTFMGAIRTRDLVIVHYDLMLN